MTSIKSNWNLSALFSMKQVEVQSVSKEAITQMRKFMFNRLCAVKQEEVRTSTDIFLGHSLEIHSLSIPLIVCLYEFHESYPQYFLDVTPSGTVGLYAPQQQET